MKQIESQNIEDLKNEAWFSASAQIQIRVGSFIRNFVWQQMDKQNLQFGLTSVVEVGKNIIFDA